MNAPRRISWRGAFAVLALAAYSPAQLDVDRVKRGGDTGYIALQQAVKDASTDRVALLIASHPDDQYVLPAAYLRFKLGFRVAVILFTRGKGGQNSSGAETGEALAQLRTLEAERCARHLGVDLYYLNRPDDGFSRSAAETLEQWGEAKTVQNLVRLVRLIRPDVVLTAHHPAEIHGHDLALLQVLPKAVAAAADPSFVTEGEKSEAFTVSRLFRGATPDEEERIAVSLEMDLLDQARGKYYRQLAYDALQEHRSQYPLQKIHELFPAILDLVPVKIGDQALHESLADDLPDLFTELRDALPKFDVATLRDVDFPALQRTLESPSKLSAAAIRLQRKLRGIVAPKGSDLNRRLHQRIRSVERVIAHSAGVHVYLRTTETEAAPGKYMALQLWIGNAGTHRISDIGVSALEGGRLNFVDAIPGGSALEPQSSLPLSARYRPPDLDADGIRRLFTRDRFGWPMRLRFEMKVDGQPITIDREIRRGLHPAVRLTVTPRTLLLPRGATEATFVVGVERKGRQAVDFELHVLPPAGAVVPRHTRLFRMSSDERFRELTFTLKAPDVRFGVSTMDVDIGDHRVPVNVHKVDVTVRSDLRVGLIPGRDDAIGEVLRALVGDARLFEFKSDRPLPILDPERLHTIVVDIRAFRSKSVMAGSARLLEFVKAGGRLVVFYHKDKEFNSAHARFRGSPYPLVIGKGRVTHEDAPIKLLAPRHVVFRYPNRIRTEDWDGWRHERGLYFPAEYDSSKYTELLEMRDPGCAVERGALLYAKYGKGDYVYCALSLYRQLKHRHAGACRLLANLISPKRDP